MEGRYTKQCKINVNTHRKEMQWARFLCKLCNLCMIINFSKRGERKEGEEWGKKKVRFTRLDIGFARDFAGKTRIFLLSSGGRHNCQT